jgi:hypothetical protein
MHLQASYLISVGHLDDAERVALESVAVAERIGDRMSASVGLNIASICDYLRGRLTRMLSRSESNEAHGGGEHRVLRACSLGIALCELGQPEKALAVLQARAGASASEKEAQLRVARATVLGVTALVHARSGALPEAWKAVQEILQMGVPGELVPASCSVILTGPMVATLKRWAEARAGGLPDAGVYAKTAQALLRQLRAYARVFRPGIAMLPYFEGHIRALQGDERAAQRAWSAAAESARALGMRHYEGLAHLELGRAHPEQSAARTEHLGRAAELLADCGLSDYERLSDAGATASLLRAPAS